MHLVESMAYAGEKPWHGLGNPLFPDQPLEVWAQRAGMDWRIESADVRYLPDLQHAESLQIYPDQKVLYRSDNRAPLSVVSSRYQVVQPTEILEFYRDLIEVGGYEMETAGVLKEGRKLWALAKTGHSVTLKGRDTLNGYLLLATACDGTLATTAQFTSVRVVCNNTLAIALGTNTGCVKVGHRSQFDPQAVKEKLGIATSSWVGFMARVQALSQCRLTDKAAETYLREVLSTRVANAAHAVPASERAMRGVFDLYVGRGMGAALVSSKGTAWGLLNSVTEYVDHHRRSRSHDHRRDAAWFGQGAAIKQRAWEEAVRLAA